MNLYGKLKAHEGHIGMYVEVDKKGDVLLRCFSRLHGGRDIILMRVKPPKKKRRKSKTARRKQ